MRVVMVSITLLAVLLGFGVFASHYIGDTADSLAAQTAAIEGSAMARNWARAEVSFSRLDSSWQKADTKWAILIDHQELDNINITMSRAKQFLDTRDLPNLLSELAELKMLFRHIPEKESVNLKNVL